jgi:hypothetical protein
MRVSARTHSVKMPSHRPKPLFTDVFALEYRPKVVPRAYLPRFLPSQRRAMRWQSRIYQVILKQASLEFGIFVQCGTVTNRTCPLTFRYPP